MDALIKDQRFISLVKEISQGSSQEPSKEPLQERSQELLRKYSTIFRNQLRLKTLQEDLDPKSFGLTPQGNLLLHGHYNDMKNQLLSDKGFFFKLNIKNNKICSITNSKPRKNPILEVGEKLELAFEDGDYICYVYEMANSYVEFLDVLKNTFDECIGRTHGFSCVFFCFLKI